MTALQLNEMYTELWQNLGLIAGDESMLKRLSRYVKKLVKEKEDPTLMTEEEFFSKVEKAEQQMERGEYSVLLPGEDLTTHLKRLGYGI